MAEVIHREYRRRYHWPEAQLNLWLIIIIAAAATCLGIFAYFMSVQAQFHLKTPWLFPFMVTICSLTLTFWTLFLLLAFRRLLIPGIILLGSFILFVLWLTGLIETSIQLYGSSANVNGNCNALEKFEGISIETLAYLTQSTICNLWKAAFAFEIVAAVFLVWMMIMSWQVNRDDYD